jgi:hypothetical protein
MMQGLVLKGRNTYAGKGGEDLEVVKGYLKRTIDNLLSGNWAETTESKGPRVSDLVLALARASGETVEDCIEVLEGIKALPEGQSKAVLKKLRQNPDVALALADIAYEKKQAAVKKAQESGESASLGDLLGGLGGAGGTEG